MEAFAAEAPTSNAEGSSRVQRRKREDRGAEGAEKGKVWGMGVPFPSGEGSGERLCPSLEIFRFLNSKKRVSVHSGTDKTYTFDRPGVSIFWPAAVLGWGRSPRRPLPAWIRPCSYVIFVVYNIFLVLLYVSAIHVLNKDDYKHTVRMYIMNIFSHQENSGCNKTKKKT